MMMMMMINPHLPLSQVSSQFQFRAIKKHGHGTKRELWEIALKANKTDNFKKPHRLLKSPRLTKGSRESRQDQPFAFSSLWRTWRQCRRDIDDDNGLIRSWDLCLSLQFLKDVPQSQQLHSVKSRQFWVSYFSLHLRQELTLLQLFLHLPASVHFSHVS